MAVTVKKVALWRTEVPQRPGELARVLGPLADAGGNLRVVMGYGMGDHAVVELFPVAGKKAVAAAQSVGLGASPIPCVLAEGDDRSGLGRDMASAIAGAGVNISFLMAETVGRKFSAVFGFANDVDAGSAMKAIKAASRPAKKRRR
jgi:hypothetical protein